MASMDDRDLGYLVNRCLLHPQRQHHESINRWGSHCRPRVLVRYKDLDPSRGNNGYYNLKGDDIDELCRPDQGLYRKSGSQDDR